MDEFVWIVLIAASVFFLPLILAIVALNKAEKVARELFKLKNDCLLYTSPSPRDRQKSRMPSSA
jgi:hypothetical protein